MKPLIICAAVTGNSKAKSRTAYHPSTPVEVARSAVECGTAGAAIVHIHGRLPDGTTSSEVTVYRDTVDRILAAGCNAVLNLSAGDDGGKAGHDVRWRVPDAGTEVVSLAVGSFNAGNRVYDNSPDYVRRMAEVMQRAGARPAIEIFDFGHLHNVRTLIDAKLLTPPYYFELVFGAGGGLPLEEHLLPLLVEKLPQGSEWSVICKTADARIYQRFMLYAFTHDGHVRTGIEDIIHLQPGVLARTNAELVEQWTKTARLWGRPLASPSEARAMLGIEPGKTAAYLNSRQPALASENIVRGSQPSPVTHH